MYKRLKAFACISSNEFASVVKELERYIFSKEAYLILLSDTVIDF